MNDRDVEQVPKIISDEMEPRSYGASTVSIAISLKRIADNLDHIVDELAAIRTFK
jgi:hypothetical protein